ncbi:site-specific DNA-methyltransferase [Methanospirillum stamsii]|uniref:Site-specific DNA-methyltransferase n=1 Tax=Methanospirillum stamsii TaxID=1277351 RepID=A0A2V2NCX2_9EURY|nr:site-specific DNA-methyltransferase [Methanospirillum stamsii]PWR75456.1 site-specific DNA-methyltransferase [Methanospirillum stamsii]
MPPKKQPAKSGIDAIRHNEKRKNIPTEELRDFVIGDEHNPSILRYPRDPSLDPQLVWKGKDEQDGKDLEVPSVPIYIQEKIHPKVIIEEFLENQKKADGVKEAGSTYQVSLFDDFNGLPEEFDERVEFYQHDQNWSNRMILGDSLLVMASLAEKEGLKGKVQTIYLDPPYGIKFGSNWQVSTRKRNVSDSKADDVTRQPEQVKAFRDTWELGIHSYLSYIRDRLIIARELLSESGSIFIQIGDENVHLIRSLLDEIFGTENFCAQIAFVKTTSQTSKLAASSIDYILWYGKNRECIKYRQIFQEKGLLTDKSGVYSWIEFPNLMRQKLTPMQKAEIINSPKIPGKIFMTSDITSQSGGSTTGYEITFYGQKYLPGKGFWKTHSVGVARLIRSNRITRSGSTLRYVRYIDDFPAYPYVNLWTDTGTGSFTEDKVFVVQTSTKVIERCILMTTDPGDLVLDPTCGSGTTAYVAEQWGRRWITIDTSRVALALARTRLMAARYPFYYLSDSPEGLEQEAKIIGRDPIKTKTLHDIRKGFVYKRVPHITLKSIANNEDIDSIYEKYLALMEPVREKINKKAKQKWEEWEIPRPEDGPKEITDLLEEWWNIRIQRQDSIDESIAQRADTELLYDQPYEDKKRVRVTGPFTVESLSPHRVLPADGNIDGVVSSEEKEQHQDFTTIIIDNIRKAGVQNTKKNERLKLDTLELFAGSWIHATGTYHEEDGTEKRVALSIGPEHGTVGPQQVKEAVKEAVQGLGYDLLLVCGFAFDPHVSEEVKRYGNLMVLPVKMNPDLAMGDELLKKTGSGNLFMIFGEPDIDIVKDKGFITVELKGVDVYDPTTGQVRSSSTDDVACWFIDTDYNGESFFVRHAYFTGADKPYDKLKKALKAEVNESAWEEIYRTVSRTFLVPESGKIAVKVINHYGDEVLKVFGV